MSGVDRLKSIVGGAVFVLLAAVTLQGAAFAAADGAGGEASAAKVRRALVVGVGDYEESSGLARLLSPAQDADDMDAALSRPGLNFEVKKLKDDQVKDKKAFDEALQEFLANVGPGDDVLFYFSGHGYFIEGKGNYFLLPSAKNRVSFLQFLQSTAKDEARALDSEDKKNKRYEQWLSEVAISENEIVEKIREHKPDVTIVIADACRSFAGSTKGISLAKGEGGLSLPAETSTGVFRLYSAQKGQLSNDGIAPPAKKSKDKGEASADTGSKRKGSPGRKPNSLYTRMLLANIVTPRLELNELHARVKRLVRNAALRSGATQIPDFSEGLDSTDFYFFEGDDRGDTEAACRTAADEVERLRIGVTSGSVSRDEIEAKRGELAPCGKEYLAEIDKMARLQAQGAGELQAQSVGGASDLREQAPASADAGELCDQLAASPFDPNRPQGVAGVDVRSKALAGLASEAKRTQALDEITRAITACEKAVQERGRVARFKFNLAGAQYALATLSEGVPRLAALAQASKLNQEAVDLGYAAAYNNLAVMFQNGETAKAEGNQIAPQAPDRKTARDLLQRGADLGDVLALYNLGLAYKNGDLGVNAELASEQTTEVTSAAKAYQYLSKAAETGFVPAMIETALALKDGRGIDRDTKRAIELLEIASSRGSWEAMYQLGEIYRFGTETLATDESAALVWYARAAEAGDTRSQARLADMLTEGTGLPSAQREAAGRYWRLAAAGGDEWAQMKLANLVRDGKVPFRPKLKGEPDSGAEEIRNLYYGAFVRGNPRAGYELAKLYRTGFPAGRGSEAIPKNPELAVALIWEAITRSRQSPDDSAEANPLNEHLFGSELIRMYDAGDAKRADGTDLITDDQIEQLRADYGDPDKIIYVKANALAEKQIWCRSGKEIIEPVVWVGVWDANTSVSPVERQFDWYERYHHCKDKVAEEKAKDGDKDKEKKKKKEKEVDLGFSKKIRDIVKREYDEAEKAKEKEPDKARSFTDRIVDLVSKDKKRDR